MEGLDQPNLLAGKMSFRKLFSENSNLILWHPMLEKNQPLVLEN